MLYRQRTNHDTWHWQRACSNWPKKKFEELDVPEGTRPTTGELCNQCLAKEKKANR